MSSWFARDVRFDRVCVVSKVTCVQFGRVAAFEIVGHVSESTSCTSCRHALTALWPIIGIDRASVPTVSQ
jgi:hypothetical protein